MLSKSEVHRLLLEHQNEIVFEFEKVCGSEVYYKGSFLQYNNEEEPPTYTVRIEASYLNHGTPELRIGKGKYFDPDLLGNKFETLVDLIHFNFYKIKVHKEYEGTVFSSDRGF